MSTVGLVEALRQRAQTVAGVLAPRVTNPGPGPWEGYTSDENLAGKLLDHETIRYWRRGNPDAMMHMGFISMINIENEEVVKTIVEGNVEEREVYRVNITEPIIIKHIAEHTFEETVSEAEALKEAWEVAAKASLGVSVSGVTGSFEASAKYGQEVTRNAARAGKRSNTVRDELTIDSRGVKTPWIFSYEAYRSLDREKKTVVARCDFDFKLYFGTWEWLTYHDVFLSALRGEEPEYTDYTKFGGSSSLREIIQANPVSDEEMAALLRGSDKTVEFIASYDTVKAQHINVLGNMGGSNA